MGDSEIRSVLLCDEVDSSLNRYAQALGDQGHEVITAGDGEEAWRCFVTDRPDVVVTHLKLPRLSGETLFRRIRDESPGTPVALICSRLDLSEAEALLEAGACDVLVKPFTTRQLVGLVENALLRLGLKARRGEDGPVALAGQLTDVVEELHGARHSEARLRREIDSLRGENDRLLKALERSEERIREKGEQEERVLAVLTGDKRSQIAHIEELKQKIREAEVRADLAQNRLDHADELVAQEVRKYDEALESIRAETAELRLAKEGVEVERDDALAAVEDLRISYEHLEGKYKVLLDERAAEEQETRRLRASFDEDLGAARARLAEVEGALRDLEDASQTRIRELEEQHELDREAVENRERRIRSLAETEEALCAERERLEGELVEERSRWEGEVRRLCEAQEAELRKLRSESEERLRGLREAHGQELDRLHRERDERLAELRQEKDRAYDALRDRSREELESIRGTHREEVEGLRRRLEEDVAAARRRGEELLEAEATKGREKLEAAEQAWAQRHEDLRVTAETRVAELEGALAREDGRRKEAQERLEAVLAELEELRQAKEGGEEKLRERLEELHRAKEDLEEKLEERHRLTAALEEEIRGLEAVQAERDGTIEALEEDLLGATRQRKKLREDLAEARRYAAEMLGSLKDVEASKSGVIESAERLREERRTLAAEAKRLRVALEEEKLHRLEELGALTRERDQARVELEALQEALRDSEQERHLLRTREGALKAELAAMESRLSAAESAADEGRRRLQEAARSGSALDEARKEHEKALAALRGELDAERRLRREDQLLVDELRGEIETLRGEAESLRDSLGDRETIQQELEGGTEVLEAALEAQRAECRRLQEQAERDRIERDGRIQVLEAALKRAEEEHRAAVEGGEISRSSESALKQQIQALELQIEGFEKERQALERELSESREAQSRAEKEWGEAKRARKAARAALDKTAEVAQELGRLRKASNQMREEMQGRLNEAETLSDERGRRIRELEKEIERLRSAAERVGGLQSAVQASSDRESELEADLVRLRGALAENAERLAEAESRWEELEVECVRLRKEAVQATTASFGALPPVAAGDATAVEAELAAERIRGTTLERKLEEAQNEIERLRSDIIRLRETASSARSAPGREGEDDLARELAAAEAMLVKESVHDRTPAGSAESERGIRDFYEARIEALENVLLEKDRDIEKLMREHSDRTRALDTAMRRLQSLSPGKDGS